jgi:hypothetical protein
MGQNLYLSLFAQVKFTRNPQDGGEKEQFSKGKRYLYSILSSLRSMKFVEE